MISLSDGELAAILEIARPLDPRTRDGFLRAVAAELAALPAGQRGPGEAHKIAAGLQRRFLGPAPLVA